VGKCIKKIVQSCGDEPIIFKTSGKFLARDMWKETALNFKFPVVTETPLCLNKKKNRLHNVDFFSWLFIVSCFSFPTVSSICDNQEDVEKGLVVLTCQHQSIHFKKNLTRWLI